MPDDHDVLSTPIHLGIFLFERETGKPLAGIPFSATAEYLPTAQFHKFLILYQIESSICTPE
jgi:hypothetical protein